MTVDIYRREDPDPAMELYLDDGKMISLAEARRRWGREILHSPVGSASTYIEIEVHGGIWSPVYLDFFGGVVGYRFKCLFPKPEIFYR